MPYRRHHWFRHRWAARHRQGRDHRRWRWRRRPKAFAFLHSLRVDQPNVRPSFDQTPLQGPNHAVVTACSTGAHAIGDAARMVALDDADVMIAGGAEAAVCRLGLAGFCASQGLEHQVQRRADQGVPSLGQGSRRLRDGRGRRRRGSRGVATREKTRREDLCRSGRVRPFRRRSSTSPRRPKTAAAVSAPCGWLCGGSGLNPEDIDYVNAHGTSTLLGDEIELGAVKRLFGDAASKLPYLPPNPPLDTWCRGRGGSHLLAFSPSTTAWRRRPSIWKIRWKPARASTLCL